MVNRVSRFNARLELAARALQAVSPLATLDRGYAIVSNTVDSRIVTDAANIAPGTSIDVRLSRGELSATVDEARPDDDQP